MYILLKKGLQANVNVTITYIYINKGKSVQKNATYALFGGSFDPPHLGHLEIIKKALELESVDKIIVMPTYLNPFKNSFSVEPKKRLAWAKEAFNLRGVEVSSFEIEQNRAVYTIESFKHLKKELNLKYIIIGADNLKSITKWSNFEYLNSQICWIVATRDGQKLELNSLREYILLNISIDVSSSEIRDGKKLEFLNKKIKSQVLLEYNINNNINEDTNE